VVYRHFSSPFNKLPPFPPLSRLLLTGAESLSSRSRLLHLLLPSICAFTSSTAYRPRSNESALVSIIFTPNPPKLAKRIRRERDPPTSARSGRSRNLLRRWYWETEGNGGPRDRLKRRSDFREGEVVVE
jgi:hypothetical protein